MTWIQFGLLALVNFVSVLAAVGVIRGIDNRRKRKVVESFVELVQEKISTEMNFQDLVKRFEEGERRND
jgi:hypothetical protein